MTKKITREQELKMRKDAIVMRMLAELTDWQLANDNDTFDLSEDLRDVIVDWGNK